jgi:DNA-binding XRE family transcriptional regulator
VAPTVEPEQLVESALAGGERLNLPQKARVAVGLSQRRFAELIGVSRSVVERWEKGRPIPGAARSLLKLIAEHPAIALATLRDQNGAPQLGEPDLDASGPRSSA